MTFRWGNQVSERCCCWLNGLRVSNLPSAFPAPHPDPRQATYPYVVLRVPPSREPKIIPTPKQRPSRPRAAGRSAGTVRSVMTIWAAAGRRELSWTRPLTEESPLRCSGHALKLLQLGQASQPLHPDCIPPAHSPSTAPFTQSTPLQTSPLYLACLRPCTISIPLNHHLPPT